MKKYCTHRYTSLIVRKFPIKIKKKKYRNALILTQDTSNQSCRVRLTHVRTERYILIVSTLRVKYSKKNFFLEPMMPIKTYKKIETIVLYFVIKKIFT